MQGAVAIILVALCFGAMGSWGSTTRAAGGGAEYARGMAAAASGNYAVAAADFEQALRAGQTTAPTFYQLGLAYSHLNRWNDALWALATTQVVDPTFPSGEPGYQAAFAAAAAKGVDVGAPSTLRNVPIVPGTGSAKEAAAAEARAAYSALQTGAYFVAPWYSKVIGVRGGGLLSANAEDLANNHNIIAKFAFLGSTPPGYSDLSSYAHDLFAKLVLQQAEVVVITPNDLAAYSDRLDSAAVEKIVAAQQRSQSTGDPVAQANGIAYAVAKQADDTAAATTRKSIVIGIGASAVVLVVLVLLIARVARREPAPLAGRRGSRSRMAKVRPRS